MTRDSFAIVGDFIREQGIENGEEGLL